MKKVECIIMDWAGTSVDYGCMAPVAAFVESFKNIGLEVTPEETRAFMGLTKIEEIRALFAIERVAEDFRLKFGRDYDDSDVQGRYNDFQRVLFATLEDYSEPIPNFSFMEEELTARADEFEKTVVSMHAHPFADVFNDNVAKPFQYYVTQYPGLQFCTAAHNHGFDDRVLFDDDVHYIVSDCMKSRSYLVFTITPEKYEYELVEY